MNVSLPSVFSAVAFRLTMKVHNTWCALQRAFSGKASDETWPTGCVSITRAYCISQQGKTPHWVFVPTLWKLCPPPQYLSEERQWQTSVQRHLRLHCILFIHIYLHDMCDFSLTHSVLNVLSDHWHAVSCGHVTHVQSSQWRAILCTTSCHILELSFNLFFLQVFATTKVSSSRLGLLLRRKFTVCEVPYLLASCGIILDSPLWISELSSFMLCFWTFTVHGNISFFILKCILKL